MSIKIWGTAWLLAGTISSASAAALPTLDGKWQCQSPEANTENEKSWVIYDFSEQGMVKSQEWIQYKKQRKTQLEYNLFVDYRFTQKGDDYVLKPVKLSREIIADPLNIDPFNAEQRRDLTGYRIFFKPTIVSRNKANFEMWYHITPDHHFTMQCEQQAS